MKFSNNTIQLIASLIFITGMCGIAYFELSCWPTVALILGASIATHQYLSDRLIDVIASIMLSGGIFLVAKMHIDEKLFLPMLFVIASIYHLIRVLLTRSKPHEDSFEDIIHEETQEGNSDD